MIFQICFGFFNQLVSQTLNLDFFEDLWILDIMILNHQCSFGIMILNHPCILLPLNPGNSFWKSLGDNLLSVSIEIWDIASDISEHTDSISTSSSSTMSLHCSAKDEGGKSHTLSILSELSVCFVETGIFAKFSWTSAVSSLRFIVCFGVLVFIHFSTV